MSKWEPEDVVLGIFMTLMGLSVLSLCASLIFA